MIGPTSGRAHDLGNSATAVLRLFVTSHSVSTPDFLFVPLSGTCPNSRIFSFASSKSFPQITLVCHFKSIRRVNSDLSSSDRRFVICRLSKFHKMAKQPAWTLPVTNSPYFCHFCLNHFLTRRSPFSHTTNFNTFIIEFSLNHSRHIKQHKRYH